MQVAPQPQRGTRRRSLARQRTLRGRSRRRRRVVTSGAVPRYGRGVPRQLPRWTFAVALCAIAVLRAGLAAAQAPPAAERAQVYSPYEQETITAALASLHATLAADPEGKIVDHIEVLPLDVIEKRDPLPNLLNIFHVTTRASLIRGEMLLHEGEPFRQVLVDETIRNLRQLPQLSIVLIVATASSTPGHIGVVVITKDVWSLRLSWNVVATPGGIELFEVHPEERNLFGVHQTANATFIYEPSAFTFGTGYEIPRIAKSRVAVVASADVMINRASGTPEGSFGSLVAGQPLYSGLAEWAWDATTQWQDVVSRRYVNAQLGTFEDTATGLSIPYQYRSREFTALYELRRSFGWNTKHDFTFAAGVDQTQYRVDQPGADPRTVADFVATDVPVSDTRVGPSFQYETYTKRYLRVIDFDTLALQEDYRLGHDIVLKLAPSIHALGSTLNILSIGASAQYTWALRDGLFRVGVATLTEPTPTFVAQAFVEPYAHLVTPTIAGIGRIMVDGNLRYRWRDYLNETTFLGGGDRLRGYPTNFLVGRDYVVYNVEFRTRPVEILSCQLAAVGFFDAGDAFTGWSQLQPFQSLGIGLRALFPQLDRGVFRADLGFPIERTDPATGARIAPLAFLVSFGQALDVPSIAPTPVLPTEQGEVLDAP